MTAKFTWASAILAFAIASLTGCASTTPQVQRNRAVSAAILDEAKYQTSTTHDTNMLLYRLSTAAATHCTATDATHRAPFSLLFNEANASEELRTAIYQVSGAAELPVIQAHVPDLKNYDGVRVLTVNGQSTKNINKVYSELRNAMESKRSLELTLEGNLSFTTKPSVACPSFVLTDYSGQLKEAFNNFNGFEVIPRSWLQITRNDGERAFVLARSIYFTGAEGDRKLRHAFYGGSAVSGVLRGLTFGLGTLIVDPKTIAVRMRRNANRSDADLFALKVVQQAGFDPHAALAFAERSVEEGGAWPEATDELKFDPERLATLRQALQQTTGPR